eukprot:762960-Hanusia_phi.AAC.1
MKGYESRGHGRRGGRREGRGSKGNCGRKGEEEERKNNIVGEAEGGEAKETAGGRGRKGEEE